MSTNEGKGKKEEERHTVRRRNHIGDFVFPKG